MMDPKRQWFIAHCMCDSRFHQLLHHIETVELSEVIELRQIHTSLPNNPKYKPLEEQFIKRIGV